MKFFKFSLFTCLVLIIFSGIALAAPLTFINYHTEDSIEAILLKEFGEEKGVETDWIAVPASNYHDKIALDLFASKATWDVFYSWQAWTMEFENYLEDITDRIPENLKEDIVGAAGDAVMSEGKWFGMPMFLSIYVLYYNEELLSEVGFNHPPKNFDELAEIAEAVYKKSGGEIYGFAREGVAQGPFQTFLILIQAVGGDFYAKNDKGELVPNINNEYGKRALEIYKILYGSEWVDPQSLTSLDPVIRRTVASGKVAMAICPAGSVNPIVENDFPENIGKVKCALIPGDLGSKKALPGAKRSASITGSMGPALWKKALNKELAIEYMLKLATPEWQKRILDYYGFVPILKSMASNEDIIKNYPYVNIAIEQANYPHNRWADEKYNAIQEAVTPILDSVVSGSIELDEALEQMEIKVKEIRGL